MRGGGIDEGRVRGGEAAVGEEEQDMSSDACFATQPPGAPITLLAQHNTNYPIVSLSGGRRSVKTRLFVINGLYRGLDLRAASQKRKWERKKKVLRFCRYFLFAFVCKKK